MDQKAELSFSHLYRLCLGLFLAYLTVGIPLPVISLFVHNDLGLSNFYVGLAIGIQFVATLLTRGYAGKLADTEGGRKTTIHGMFYCGIAGLFYLASSSLDMHVALKFILLLVGRICLGYGESQLLTGNLSWSLGLYGPKNSGKVMAWVGMAIFGSLAIGSPIGLAIQSHFGLKTLCIVVTLIPILAYLLERQIPDAEIHAGQKLPLRNVFQFIMMPGVVLALQGVGFAVISTFISLYFHENQWENAGLALTCFGGAFILVRIFGAHYLDKLGAIRTTQISLLIEALGLGIIYLATDPLLAFLGAAISGCGCSLIFPALGSTIVKQVPPQVRGTAMGGYAAFQDVSYAMTSPLTGLLANHFGYSAVFATGGVCAVLGLLVLSKMSVAIAH